MKNRQGQNDDNSTVHRMVTVPQLQYSPCSFSTYIIYQQGLAANTRKAYIWSGTQVIMGMAVMGLVMKKNTNSESADLSTQNFLLCKLLIASQPFFHFLFSIND